MSRSSFVRELGLWDASAIVIGCIIGAGIFRVPSSIAAHLDSPLPILLTWLFGGVLSICGALCYAELSSLFPKTGGDYVFLRESYGPMMSFLFGWTKLFVERTGTIAIIAFVFADYAGYLFPIAPGAVKWLASGAILLLTFANVLGVKYGKNIQNVFTALKVLALAAIIVLGFAFLPREMAAGRTFPIFHASPVSFSMIQSAGMALIFVLWTYGGWTEAAYVAEEVKDPTRNVPLSIIGGLSLVIVLYMAINAVYYLYIPIAQMKETRLVASIVVAKLLGPWGGKAVACCVVISTFGALNGYILTGGRILYALAGDHALFHKFAAIHPRTHTPALALCFNGLCAILLVMTKTLDQLVEYTTVMISIFFALTGWSVFRLRAKLPDAPRSYKVWGYPWVPLIFVASTFLFIGNALVREPRECFFGFLLTSAGFFLYLISKRMASLGGSVKVSPNKT